MAADGVNKLQLTLVHGQQKYALKIELPSEEAGDVLCVRHLAAEVESKTGVPVKGQKLIFKGKSLSTLSDSLSILNLKPGSKVMLIGKKPNSPEDQTQEALKKIETVIARHEKKLSDLTVELDGVHRGFVPNDIKGDLLHQLSKKICSCTEDFMKDLESLDAVQVEENFKEARAKRKNMVDRCQVLLRRCCHLENGLNMLIMCPRLFHKHARIHRYSPNSSLRTPSSS